jgi:multiple sugar transport system substrate-binding protein
VRTGRVRGVEKAFVRGRSPRRYPRVVSAPLSSGARGHVKRRASLASFAALSASALLGPACRPRARGGPAGRTPGERAPLVLKHQPFWGDPATFRAVLAAFEEARGVRVVAEPLPNDADLVHQFFLTALEGGAADFDVFLVDTVWVAEFARAGWLVDLSSSFPPAIVRTERVPGAAAAAIVDGHTWAVPFYVDVGLLYRRRDWFPEAPRTYEELAQMAVGAVRDGHATSGFVWQGRQYEGLVCNVCEAIWGHLPASANELVGSGLVHDGRVVLDTPVIAEALGYLRHLVTSGASPRTVTSQGEEESRRVFQGGGAAFMRNWPYAFAEAQRDGSPVRDRVALSPLPTRAGTAGHGTLGGYLLAVNAHVSPARQALGAELVAHLTSAETGLRLALAYGRSPAHRAVYADPRLVAGAPFLASLEPMIRAARPRPVTPYYGMISDILQGELSAAVVGLRSPEESLRRAQALVDHVMGRGP